MRHGHANICPCFMASEGGVRAVALPHRDLTTAKRGLDAEARQVR